MKNRNFFSIAALPVAMLAAMGLPAQSGKRAFTGVITDSECDRGDHSRMKMGANDAECVIACIREHGAQYVLFDGEHSYYMSDQKTPERFASKRVTVTGTLDAKTKMIQVESISAAN